MVPFPWRPSLAGAVLTAVVVLPVAAPTLVPRAARAETVTVVGADGSQPGEAGQSATARADAPCQDNTANATGGDGGSATGTPGGNGGDATAEATATCGTRVVAHADAGSGGFGSPNGAGGAATATATLDTNTAAMVSGRALAEGGEGGGFSSTLPGAAVATLVISNAGSGGVLAVTGLGDGAIAYGGDAYSANSGDASADARATGGGDVSIESQAAGGVATARTTGISTGAGRIYAAAYAVSESGGAVDAAAYGSSAGGGDVTVFAREASYSDVEVMRDAVAGSTSGRLKLTQDVVARGALASLDATNPGGGDLTVEVTARGTRGSSAGPHGGSAIVESVTATAAGSVDVLAVAEGGDSGGVFDPPVAAGVGEVRQVVGRSTGGAPVTVRAHAAGGGNGYLATGAVADASLVNAVSAETSGAITLEQIAKGGVASGFGGVGNVGNALSRLDVDRSSASLDIHSEANGRIAEATSDSTNRAGGVRLNVSADGIDEATVSASAASFGDGHAVTVGSATAPGAHGIQATSTSVGTAHGNSVVTVYDRAKGETVSSHASGSNEGASNVEVHSVAEGENGGTGSISASGSSSGGGFVLVRGEVLGGDRLGGDNTGGVAQIVDGVSGSSTGRVRLELLAEGGNGGGGFLGVNGTGGDAHVEIDQSNTGGGDLEISARANGGWGLGSGGVAGHATLGPVIGRSANGRDVTVEGIARAGLGTGTGMDVMLTDAVGGDTSGNLKLVQEAVATGVAYSELNKQASAASLWVETAASPFLSSPQVGTALSTAANTGGGATAKATATGIQTSTAVAHSNTEGGDATATAAASRGVSTAEAIAISAGAGAAAADARAIGSIAPNATAFASNAGSGAVKATALAERTAASAPTQLRAEGRSMGGGNVTVSTELRSTSSARDDLSLDNAVSGSTAGRLSLLQTVRRSAFGSAGSPGDVRTALQATNPGGGDLAITMSATTAAGLASDAILGDVIGTSNAGSDVAINVFAAGDQVRQEKLAGDGSAVASRIFGQSNGGDVAIDATFAVGNGGTAYGDGRAIDLENAVGGDTTGALSLTQTARAGSGRGASFFDPQAGSGGDARSVLVEDAAVSSLTLHARGLAGSAGFTSGSSTATPGQGYARVDASNSAGAATARATASGGSATASGGTGGSAHTEATARTRGDGHAVVVGAPLATRINPSLDPGAFGGSGASGSTGALGAGGFASSVSTGIAEGDSSVTVFDAAIGGIGGSFTGFGSTNAVGGWGGGARSEAQALGAGPSTVTSKAEARGGTAGSSATSAGRGGDAEAFASATGLGEVEAWGRAVGGSSLAGFQRTAGIGGSASAHAIADGATGFARAEAITGAGALPQLRAQSEVAVGSRRDAVATATNGAALASAPSDAELEGSAFLTGAPLAEDSAMTLAHNASAAAMFDEHGGSRWLALGRWQGSLAPGSDGRVSVATDFEILLAGVDPSSKIELAAFDVSVLGDAFEALSLTLKKNGVALGDTAHFASVDAVRSFFEDTVIDLGTGLKNGDSLLAHFDFQGGAATSFGMGVGFAMVVPEPGTGALLIVGLGQLVRRRHSRIRGTS